MKTILAILAASMISTQAGAVAEATYKCGPYTYEIFGPYYTALFTQSGEELGRWEDDSKDPSFFKGNTLFLKWNKRTNRCIHKGSTP